MRSGQQLSVTLICFVSRGSVWRARGRCARRRRVIWRSHALHRTRRLYWPRWRCDGVRLKGWPAFVHTLGRPNGCGLLMYFWLSHHGCGRRCGRGNSLSTPRRVLAWMRRLLKLSVLRFRTIGTIWRCSPGGLAHALGRRRYRRLWWRSGSRNFRSCTGRRI